MILSLRNRPDTIVTTVFIRTIWERFYNFYEFYQWFMLLLLLMMILSSETYAHCQAHMLVSRGNSEEIFGKYSTSFSTCICVRKLLSAAKVETKRIYSPTRVGGSLGIEVT